MQIKKSGNMIFGVDLTPSEKKAMDIEVRRQLADYVRKNALEMDAMILWQLHTQLGFGPERLRKFYDNFNDALDGLLAYYEAEDIDNPFQATEELKKYGIDIQKWSEER